MVMHHWIKLVSEVLNSLFVVYYPLMNDWITYVLYFTFLLKKLQIKHIGHNQMLLER